MLHICFTSEGAATRRLRVHLATTNQQFGLLLQESSSSNTNLERFDHQN